VAITSLTVGREGSERLDAALAGTAVVLRTEPLRVSALRASILAWRAALMSARAFTVSSLAREWECSESVIRKLVRQGALRSFRIGTLIRIPADEVQRFECQTIASNDSAEDMPSSGEKAEQGDEGGSTRKIERARRPRPGEFGRPATIHRGPWAGS
jgi:excisionase family DNA binding protein